jgi:hypothetical protein
VQVVEVGHERLRSRDADPAPQDEGVEPVVAAEFGVEDRGHRAPRGHGDRVAIVHRQGLDADADAQDARRADEHATEGPVEAGDTSRSASKEATCRP